ncbi:MAG: TIGR04255 family protein [Tenericutes bacterium]|nr:TIGR04255 family protein [Mycoplasmatota bacterium]
MPKETFNFPTVKLVLFEMKFPHLFSIEKRIGDFQERIMSDFPKSKLGISRSIVFSETGPDGKLVELPDQFSRDTGVKTWVFYSEKNNIRLEVQTNRLILVSKKHKTYNNDGDTPKFRDYLGKTLENFFSIVKVPVLSRIGLRYVDEFPLPELKNEVLSKYYDSSFPLERFSLDTVITGATFNTSVKRKNHNLTYIETLIKKDDELKLVLDFDGFAKNVSPDNCLNIVDELHEIIDEEYFSHVKEPWINYMRNGKFDD